MEQVKEANASRFDFAMLRLPVLIVLLIPLAIWLLVPSDKDSESLVASISLIYILPIEVLILPLAPSAWNTDLIARQLEARELSILIPFGIILILVPAVLISLVLRRRGRNLYQASLLGCVWAVASVELLGASMVLLLYSLLRGVGPR